MHGEITDNIAHVLNVNFVIPEVSYRESRLNIWFVGEGLPLQNGTQYLDFVKAGF